MHTSGPVRNPSPPFRGERKGPTPQAWEGEVGGRRPEIPHLTPTLSAPKGGEGEAISSSAPDSHDVCIALARKRGSRACPRIELGSLCHSGFPLSREAREKR